MSDSIDHIDAEIAKRTSRDTEIAHVEVLLAEQKKLMAEAAYWHKGTIGFKVRDLERRLEKLKNYDPEKFAANEQLRESRQPEPIFSAPGEQLAAWIAQNRINRRAATRRIEYTP